MNMSIIYGSHAINSILQNAPQRIKKLCLLKQACQSGGRLSHLVALADAQAIAYEKVDKTTLANLAGTQNHQGAVAMVYPAKLLGEGELLQCCEDLSSQGRWLILDGIQDPHNLGACLRSADAVAASGIIIPKDRSATLTGIVHKVSSGAAEIIPVYRVTNLVRTMEQMKPYGVWFYGLAAEAEQSLYDTQLDGQIAFVLGSEGQGLRRLVAEACDVMLKMPMCGYVGSLNVSVSAALCLYETLRQTNPESIKCRRLG